MVTAERRYGLCRRVNKTKKKNVSYGCLPISLRWSWPRQTERENPPSFIAEQVSTQAEHSVHAAAV